MKDPKVISIVFMGYLEAQAKQAFVGHNDSGHVCE
jgi:hypothetical protein